MAKHEACELYIEQQIAEGLEDGKTPYAIGKELSAWVAKLFEINIPRETLKSRAARQKSKNGSNEPNEEITIKTDGNGGVNGVKNGWKKTVSESVEIMEKEIKKGKSQREAASIAANISGRNEATIRSIYNKKKASEPLTWTCTECGGTFPIDKTECNCNIIDINRDVLPAKIERLNKARAEIKKSKQKRDAYYKTINGQVDLMKFHLESIDKIIMKTGKTKFMLFHAARKNQVFLETWDRVSEQINSQLKDNQNE